MSLNGPHRRPGNCKSQPNNKTHWQRKPPGNNYNNNQNSNAKPGDLHAMLKKNQDVLKKARAELMVITESLGKRDNSVNIVEEKPAQDPMELMRSVDEMIAQLNEAKQLSDTTSVTTIRTSNTTQEPEVESSESD